jgi:hypothetical protein
MSRINTYEDLVAERRMLELKIIAQKEIINTGLLDLKERLEPLLNLRSAFGIFDKKTTGNSILRAVVSTGIDLIAGQGMSPKINWLARLALSFVTKKFLNRSAKPLSSNGIHATN